MAKLYFKYGAMGSSKTATALITKYNYEERGMKVWLIKPAADSRDGQFMLKSRIGLSSECEAIGADKDIRTLYHAKLFPGSMRLFELADSITEIKTICDCGRKATTNARISPEGYVVTEGDQVFLGGNDSYIAMCHKCYQDYILQHRKVELLHGSERDLT